MSSVPANQSDEDSNVVQHMAFLLGLEPVDYAISVHIRNLYATYGEQCVKNAVTELFLTESLKCPFSSDSE